MGVLEVSEGMDGVFVVAFPRNTVVWLSLNDMSLPSRQLYSSQTENEGPMRCNKISCIVFKC